MCKTDEPLSAQLVSEGHENLLLEDFGDRIDLCRTDTGVHNEEFYLEEIVACQV